MNQFELLGFSDGETTVFEAITKYNPTNIATIQSHTGIERRNIYDIINKLLDKGVITQFVENKKKLYRLTNPKHLAHLIETRKQQLATLQEKLPTYVTAYKESRKPIEAESYQGIEGIKAILTEALDFDTYWIGGNSGVETTPLKHWFSHWMDMRANNQKWMYDLVDAGKHLRGYAPTQDHTDKYYERRELPIALESPMVILLFSDKVVQILWQKRPFAFVLESKELSKSYYKWFDHFWKANHI